MTMLVQLMNQLHQVIIQFMVEVSVVFGRFSQKVSQKRFVKNILEHKLVPCLVPLRAIRLVNQQKADFAISESLTAALDRKSTRLNSSHVAISYAVFCL